VKKEIKILLASPRGFCAGVDRAIEIVKEALVKFGSPVYVRHEIVHNKHVVESLKKIGAIFVEDLREIKINLGQLFSRLMEFLNQSLKKLKVIISNL